ncbi:MAG: VWA-like domain-containing protein [Muricoprocola sp.]
MADIMEREKEFAQRMEALGQHILLNARNELYLHMRFLDVALSSLQFAMDGTIDSVATDGNTIFYNSKYLGTYFKENRKKVNRAYLHMVFHCLFCHVFAPPKEERIFWNLACDIAMESIIDDMQIRCIKTPISWLRESTYKELRSKLKVLTAEGIYHVLTTELPGEQKLQKLIREFHVDDHRYWMNDSDKNKDSSQRDKWQDISEKMEMDLQSFSKESVQADGNLREQLKVNNREKTDYRTFLRKFAVLREEMQVDPDQFDYIFYSYGLSLYGNMPLIEPMESREIMKVEEFAIVLDTSMSCSGDTIKAFLAETWSILKEEESYFRKINIHVIQCDEKVQSDVKITSKEELKDYMEKFEVRGGGGTDFRPAFAYVQELCRKKEFTNLKGLLYFTDGFGTYPQKMPPFQSAFIFMDEEETNMDVPPWAIRLVVRSEELMK